MVGPSWCGGGLAVAAEVAPRWPGDDLTGGGGGREGLDGDGVLFGLVDVGGYEVEEVLEVGLVLLELSDPRFSSDELVEEGGAGSQWWLRYVGEAEAFGWALAYGCFVVGHGVSLTLGGGKRKLPPAVT